MLRMNRFSEKGKRQNNERKQAIKYYLSVEGQTEKWYFENLKKLINQEVRAKRNVNFTIKVSQNPVKVAKSISTISKTVLYHITDYEGNQQSNITAFHNMIDKIDQAEKLGKNIECKLGYSNLSFDLWVVLHKSECNSSFSSPKSYLSKINDGYNTKYEDMDSYKEEKQFKKLLEKISLDDVVFAVKRSEMIMKQNQRSISPVIYNGHSYYKENPSLSVWEVVNKILTDCSI